MSLYLILILVFSGVGIVDTLYLSRHALAGTPVACWWFPKEWCMKVQFSKQSKTFGIPNAFLGLGMYLTIISGTLLFLGGTVPFWPIAGVIAFGFAFSMYFTYVQAFVLRAFCTWCVVSAINFIGMFIAAFILR